MKKILVVPNPIKDNNLEFLREALSLAKGRAEFFLDAKYIGSNIENVKFIKKEDVLSSVDMILVLGGDGTLLSVAREAAPYNLPILGVNLGHLGFLAEIEKNEMKECFDRFFHDDYFIEDRMMITGTCIEKDGTKKQFDALNDFVVTKNPYSTLMDIDIFVNNEFVDDYKSDGVIISTPTGSTAYSLSAGGPIVGPDVDAFVITPICPHKLYSRAIVVSDKKEINVKVTGDDRLSAAVIADGQIVSSLSCGELLTITKSERKAKLIRLNGERFYSILRQKFTGKE